MGIFNGFNTFKAAQQVEEFTASENINIEFTGFSKVNREVAFKLSSLFSGVNLISETIASLPIYKYRINENGSKIRVKENINYMLNRSCNDYLTAFDLKDLFVKSAILEGNGFILIVKNDLGIIEKLVPLKRSEVEIRKVVGKDAYKYYVNKEEYRGVYEYYELINLCLNSEDGVHGKGILEIGRESIGLGQAQQKFLGATISNGSYMKGILTTPSSTSKDQRDDLMNKIKRFFSGGNSGRVLVLPEGLKYQNISLSPADVELLQMQEFNIGEIARLLKISPHLIGGEVKSGNYGTLEQSNLQFLQYTLLPYLRRIEELFNNFLLTEDEKESGDYFFEFNIDNLLRVNKSEEIDYYTKAIDAGIMSLNEVRTKLNLDQVEGLDIITLSKFNSIVQDGKIVNTVMNETVKQEQKEQQ